MSEFLGLDKIFDYQLYVRALIILLYAIIIFRINLTRLHGNHSPLDFIIYIILGAILGEAIINKIPLIPSLIVATIVILTYRFLMYLTFKSAFIGRYVKGEKIVIIKDGKYIKKNLECARITPNDIRQALRLQCGTEKIDHIKMGILERGGEISFQTK